ncbi:MAG TPA: hypothetical protein VF498_03525 [Anaerolineales bacterium]
MHPVGHHAAGDHQLAHAVAGCGRKDALGGSPVDLVDVSGFGQAHQDECQVDQRIGPGQEVCPLHLADILLVKGQLGARPGPGGQGPGVDPHHALDLGVGLQQGPQRLSEIA